MANGNGASGYGRLLLGVCCSLTVGMMLAGVSGIISVGRQFTLLQERHEMMSRVDAYQTKIIEDLQRTLQTQEHLTLLLTERQGLVLKTIEVHSLQLTTMQALNAEQQFSLNAIRARVRFLERAGQGYPSETPSERE